MTYSLGPTSITMGDPSGVGPEIIVKTLSKQPPGSRNIVFGCPRVMQRAVEVTSVNLQVRTLKAIEDATFDRNVIEVLQTSFFEDLPLFGEVSKGSGKSSYDAIISSISHALEGKVNSIVTAPINKEALSLAGIEYPGHTEILAKFSGVDQVAMLLGNGDIRTVLVSIHCSLSEAIKAVTFEAQMKAIRFAHDGAIALGFPQPRVAVAGLNPHAGDEGLIGKEDDEVISPVVKEFICANKFIYGPFSADAFFGTQSYNCLLYTSDAADE